MKNLPLVVDLDGTLTPTDTLAESIVQVVKQNPFDILLIPLWLAKGKAALKAAVAKRVSLEANRLPYRADLIDFVRAEKARGRKVILATAAHRSIATRVAEHLGLFDEVIATDDRTNVKGRDKLPKIEQAVGPAFVYAGDSIADEPIWASARAAVLVDVPERVEARVRRHTPVEKVFRYERNSAAAWLKALRVHQWTKNLLIFVPLFTAFSLFDMAPLRDAALAFLAMSLTASATYIVNDLWDLESDRAHPRKRLRPFASGRIPILKGVVAVPSLLSLALIASLAVSISFTLMLLGYVVLTSLYSWWLKRRVLIDVFMLSILYTWRILAGSIAVGIETSKLLLAFSVLVFLSLALIKRCSELSSVQRSGATSTCGRDYQVSDLAVLWPMGVGTTLSAMIVFGLFVNAPETAARYATPNLLWLVALMLTYLLCRLWIKTVRGEMHDDPLVFVLRDAKSFGMLALVLAIMLTAHFFQFA